MKLILDILSKRNYSDDDPSKSPCLELSASGIMAQDTILKDFLRFHKFLRCLFDSAVGVFLFSRYIYVLLTL